MQIIVYKLVDAFNHVTLSDCHFAFLTILERGNKANVRNIVFLSPCGYESYHKDSTEKYHNIERTTTLRAMHLTLARLWVNKFRVFKVMSMSFFIFYNSSAMFPLDFRSWDDKTFLKG